MTSPEGRGIIFVLLPAFNEEAALGPLLDEVERTLGVRAVSLVVDDGSTDGTAGVAHQRLTARPGRVVLVRHERNLGLGEAVRSGIREVSRRARPEDVVVVLDADGTHPPLDIPRLEAALESGAEVAIASRFAPGGGEEGLSPLRKLTSHAACWILRWAFRIPGARDYTIGFRAIRWAALERAGARYGAGITREAGFASTPELLIRLARSGARVVEVPFRLRYNLKRGPSKMKVGRTILRYGALFWNLACERGRSTEVTG